MSTTDTEDLAAACAAYEAKYRRPPNIAGIPPDRHGDAADVIRQAIADDEPFTTDDELRVVLGIGLDPKGGEAG